MRLKKNPVKSHRLFVIQKGLLNFSSGYGAMKKVRAGGYFILDA
jgi:hypothetical protein